MADEEEERPIERAMVIFAHPDDAEFGSAGTIAKWAAEGVEVTYVVATDGSKGSSDPEMAPAHLSEMRYTEQREAARILGVAHVEFLGFEDGILQPTIELRKAITAAIRRYRPDVIITQNPVRSFDLNAFAQHPDHLACAEAALAAIYPCARDRLTFPELIKEGLEPHAVGEVLIVGTTSPDHWIDITTTIDKKVEALKAHLSQVGDRPVEEFVPNRAKTVAEGHDMEFAEGFKRLTI
ncbi:MAG TPA: PIG-L family deacetylase [Chloroflexota bacterium]|jgi:LmbE family N-acetylglucosaminyl deacetylase|nr:PIG-L family deacetylase [Chloroflexota bacterium]